MGTRDVGLRIEPTVEKLQKKCIIYNFRRFRPLQHTRRRKGPPSNEIPTNENRPHIIFLKKDNPRLKHKSSRLQLLKGKGKVTNDETKNANKQRTRKRTKNSIEEI